ncbi:hypothetical protein BS47DRAFT_872384 [Hydnum rufescens UP504]|uniref:Phytocyanin domain-containing protein n=1 Tax=Hydnum rufescens UP504 TaxID=1448309 RepID=A0A9P6DY18_9AGAM|nr:hypothetical protein BS47DRAFT_872384 [Hydnum rufescens UP504]
MRLSLILALASSAASAFAADQRVVVGLNGTLVFSPANFTSSVGDTVTFEFHARNHTVTQSTFSSPCTPSLNASSGTVVNSGFIPVAANATTFPTYTITINETSPLWFFCAQEPHCEKGMVGAVNAPTTGNNTFAAFLAKALALDKFGFPLSNRLKAFSILREGRWKRCKRKQLLQVEFELDGVT